MCKNITNSLLSTVKCYLFYTAGMFFWNSREKNIIEAAKIYGRDSDRVLKSYEMAVNEEAGKIALDDPTLLSKRDVLYEKAKESVRCSSTFLFNKGKS